MKGTKSLDNDEIRLCIATLITWIFLIACSSELQNRLPTVCN